MVKHKVIDPLQHVKVRDHVAHWIGMKETILVCLSVLSNIYILMSICLNSIFEPFIN